jgi:hypothetical protein
MPTPPPVGVSGGTYTYPSQTTTSHVFSFPIPAGTYASATWTITYSFATFGSSTAQLQISLPGSTPKDVGRTVTAAGTYIDVIALVTNDHIGVVNKYAGQTLAVTVTVAGGATWTNLAITAFTLSLVSHTTAFGKKWSADSLDEHVVLSWIDNDAGCFTSSHQGLAALKGALSTGWAASASLAPYAEDVSHGLFTNGRCYLTFTKSDNTKTTLTTQYRTNDQYGTGVASDWSGEAEVVHTVDGTTNAPTGGPFQAFGTKFVVSQSDTLGKNYFRRSGDRLAQVNDRTYSVIVGGVSTPQNGVYSCTDGQGATWTWRNNSGTTGGYSGNYNGYDGLLNRFDARIGTSFSDGYVGRQYNRMVGIPLVSSPIVADRHGNLCQIVYTNRYSRIAKFSPNVFDISNNDAALGFSVTTPIDIAIPTDPNGLSIGDADFCLDWTYAERPLVDCVVPAGDKPGSVTIPVGAMTGIPDPSTDYGLQVWFTLDFTYKAANNFTLRIGSDAGTPTSTWGATYSVSGRGEYTTSTRFYISNDSMQAIWNGRGGNVTLPITYSGTVDKLVLKSVKFEYDYYGSFFFGGAKVTMSSVSDPTHITVERNPNTASTNSSNSANSEFRMSTISAAPLLADMNAAAGGTWHSNMKIEKGSSGSQPATAYPYIFVVLEAFAVLSYNAAAYDFYMVRSRDGGRFWDWGNDGRPITGLASLKALNALGTGSYSVPTLAASGDAVHALWIEGGVPKCLMTQDQGDTWEV